MEFFSFIVLVLIAVFLWRINNQLPDLLFRLSEIQRDISQIKKSTNPEHETKSTIETPEWALNHPEPIELFKTDQQAARDKQDPQANLCVVSTVDGQMKPQSRTLVLREVGGYLAIFINKSSPKWDEFKNGIALQTYWTSTQIQYRMSVSTKQIDKAVINNSWQLRPDIPKKMDWIYQSGFPQSSRVDSLDQIRGEIRKMTDVENLTATENAVGLILQPPVSYTHLTLPTKRIV